MSPVAVSVHLPSKNISVLVFGSWGVCFLRARYSMNFVELKVGIFSTTSRQASSNSLPLSLESSSVKKNGNWSNFFCAAPRYLAHDLFDNDVGVVCWVVMVLSPESCRYVIECRQASLATSFDTSPEHLVFSSTVYAINVSVKFQVMTPFSVHDVLNVQLCVCHD